MDVAVLICTFGEARWSELADRAMLSAELEQPAEVIAHHGGTSLAESRNRAAAKSSAPWLCFLDADDELEPGYLDAMAATDLDRGLLAPAVRFVPCDIDREEVPAPVTLSDRNIATMNPCVIGTLLRRDMFDRAGGFWNERAWEDWSLFRRAWLLGEPVIHVPAAVYRVNVNPAGRNSTVDRPEQLHREIVRAHAIWKRKARNR